MRSFSITCGLCHTEASLSSASSEKKQKFLPRTGGIERQDEKKTPRSTTKPKGKQKEKLQQQELGFGLQLKAPSDAGLDMEKRCERYVSYQPRPFSSNSDRLAVQGTTAK